MRRLLRPFLAVRDAVRSFIDDLLLVNILIGPRYRTKRVRVSRSLDVFQILLSCFTRVDHDVRRLRLLRGEEHVVIWGPPSASCVFLGPEGFFDENSEYVVPCELAFRVMATLPSRAYPEARRKFAAECCTATRRLAKLMKDRASQRLAPDFFTTILMMAEASHASRNGGML